MPGIPFQKGYDPRRHVFTRQECQKGYEAAWNSLARRFPGCDPHFLLCAIMKSKPWTQLLPTEQELAGKTHEQIEELLLARFARD